MVSQAIAAPKSEPIAIVTAMATMPPTTTRTIGRRAVAPPMRAPENPSATSDASTTPMVTGMRLVSPASAAAQALDHSFVDLCHEQTVDEAVAAEDSGDPPARPEEIEVVERNASRRLAGIRGELGRDETHVVDEPVELVQIGTGLRRRHVSDPSVIGWTDRRTPESRRRVEQERQSLQALPLRRRT